MRQTMSTQILLDAIRPRSRVPKAARAWRSDGLDDSQEAMLRTHPVFSRCRPETLAQVRRGAVLVEVAAGRVLASQGDDPDSVLELVDGVARVFAHDAEGQQWTVRHLRAPAMSGDVDVLAGRKLTCSVETLTASRLLR